MLRAVVAVWCALAVLAGCSRQGPPSSLFDSAGYHVRDGKVYYLKAFPGKAFEIDRADAASFRALDTTYARDKSSVYVDGRPRAEPASFRVLRGAYATDDQSVFYFTDKLTAEVASFRALDGPYASDARNVYWMGKPIRGRFRPGTVSPGVQKRRSRSRSSDHCGTNVHAL